MLHLVLSRKLGKALELRRGESIRGARLERASEKQLRGKKRSKVHVETSSWRLQLVVVVAGSKSARVDARNVGALRVPVGIAAGLVCVERAVRKASVSIHLLLEALLETRSARGVGGAVVVLHSEEVRGQDEIVPRVLR